MTKHRAAFFAHGLVGQFSQKPPTGTANCKVREIGMLLYQAVSGKEIDDLKHQTDAVRKSWRGLEQYRGR